MLRSLIGNAVRPLVVTARLSAWLEALSQLSILLDCFLGLSVVSYVEIDVCEFSFHQL